MNKKDQAQFDANQKLIDGMMNPQTDRATDSNTTAENTVSSAMDAWGMAEDLQKKKDKLKKL